MKTIVPILPRSVAELEILLRQITRKVDIVEVWLDVVVQEFMIAPSLIAHAQTLIENCRAAHGVQFLGVCKTSRERGSFQGNAAQRVQLLQEFLKLGGDFVDVDITQNSAELIAQIPVEKLWLSYHNFETVPDNLANLKNQMESFKPKVYKFAVTPENEDQLKTFIEFAKHDKNYSIYTTMGEFGASGRTQLRPFSYAGFYALSAELRTATGQPLMTDL